MVERVDTKFNLNDALLLANERHKSQLDKAGKPYINHILGVVTQVRGEYSKMAAALHDIVEDTGTTIEELRGLGCPEIVLSAVNLLTHKSQNPTYEEYMADIKAIAESKNQIAIDVKWADLTNNTDRTRIPSPTERDFRRWAKYAKAKEILKPFISPYLRN